MPRFYGYSLGSEAGVIKRFELKFWMPVRTGRDILQRLGHFMKLDPHVGDAGFYVVRSLYLDTPDFDEYHDVLNGERRRRKYRLRKYAVKSETVAFEVKHKDNRVIAKERTFMSMAKARSLYENPWDHCDTELGKYAAEFARSTYTPVVTTVYQRVPLVDLLGSRVRVTFDYNLRCGDDGLFDREVNVDDLRAMAPGTAILEVKFDQVIPAWLAKTLRDFQLVATTISKYRICVNRLLNDEPMISEVQRRWMSY